jgi:hypothetical protein
MFFSIQEVKIGSRITGTIYHVDKKHNVYLKLEDENEKLQMLTAKCLRINIDNVEENSEFCVHHFENTMYFLKIQYTNFPSALSINAE